MSRLAEDYHELQERILAAMRAAADHDFFDGLWLDVHRFQRRWNEPYANFCATRPGPCDWREIPAVPQSAFKHFRLAVAPPNETGRTFRTSGTTGEGFGEHHFFNTQLYEQSVRAGWTRLGLPRLSHLVLTPRSADAPHSSLASMMGALEPLAMDTFYFINASGGLRADFVTTLQDVSQRGIPVALLGTALAFLNAFEQFGELRFRLAPGSFAMETGGFKGSGRDISKDELYAQFREYLDLQPEAVFNEYGMTELSSQFYTRGLGRPHESPPWLRAVVFDPETGNEVAIGETGVLRLFDLANLGSVLAIETQDFATRRERGFELLGRDPGALPRGCSRPVDELLQRR